MALRLAAISHPSCTSDAALTTTFSLTSSHARSFLIHCAHEKSRLRMAHTLPRPKCMASEDGAASSSSQTVNESTLPRRVSLSSSGNPAAAGFYSSMKDNHLQFWDTHDGVQESEQSGRILEANDQMLVAELRLLANAAADRAQMHSILGRQRDNWNTLFQRTFITATMTATVLAGLDGQQHSLSLSLPALALNAGCALMMAVINHFQPSQLAEEQRTAVRLFTKLVSDVNYALSLPPALRQDTASLLQDSQRRLQALDQAYPMELTPGGLEKFPSQVVPPILSGQSTDLSDPAELTSGEVNGWSASVRTELSNVATLLHKSDVQKYVSWAQNVENINKGLAISAPLFALCGAALNAVDSLGWSSELGVHAAMCSVLAAFASSFSNDMQLGMVFEMYRNSAGFYAELEASIDRTLKTAPDRRENGVLFRRRVAYELGRCVDDSLPLDPPEGQCGGKLF